MLSGVNLLDSVLTSLSNLERCLRSLLHISTILDIVYIYLRYFNNSNALKFKPFSTHDFSFQPTIWPSSKSNPCHENFFHFPAFFAGVLASVLVYDDHVALRAYASERTGFR